MADLHAAAERIWEQVAPACPGFSVEVLPETGSTNSELMLRGRRGDTSPTLLAACRQTAGRGRQGRTWASSPGDSLTFSYGVPMQLDTVPGGGSALSLAVGLCVAQAIDEGLQEAIRTSPIGLKWPNDLWRQSRKLGGILIEATPAPGLGEHERWVVIGIGLNIREGGMPAGCAALTPGTALDGLPAPTAGQVWAWIAPALARTVQAFASEGFAPLRAAYAERDVLAGQEVGLWTTPGQGPHTDTPANETGMAIGVDESGALLVHTSTGGVQSWTSGEVSVRLRSG